MTRRIMLIVAALLALPVGARRLTTNRKTATKTAATRSSVP